MTTTEITLAIILIIITIGMFVLSILQFLNIGVPINNAYIYASKEDRERMDYKPHFFQSGVVFTVLGVIFAVNTMMVFFEEKLLFNIVLIISLLLLVFAIISSIIIARKK